MLVIGYNETNIYLNYFSEEGWYNSIEKIGCLPFTTDVIRTAKEYQRIKKRYNMLTYALDEYGDFEGLKQSNEPIYIGGLIYDDHNVNGEEKLERNRIKAYYESVIADAAVTAQNTGGFVYPEALHSDGDSNRNHYVVRPVKEKIRTSLAEFIQRGTYIGNKLQYTDRNGALRNFRDRKGEYYIFVILKSDQGMTRLLNQNANILAKDDYASNLYFHMADELISRIIFYNPLINNIEEISLDIATRRSALLENSSNLFREYKEQGYIAEQAEGGRYQFKLTNPDIYRSVIAKEIIDAEQPNIKIVKFNVDSIGYHGWASRGMEFLYMSDSICSVLGFDIEGATADEWLKCIVERVHSLTGKVDNLVFGYDEIDNIYSKAWAKYAEGDYYKALSIAFDAGKLEGGFAEYYKSLWFKKLEEKIAENANVSDFNMAVRKLNETLNNNTLDQDKCFYILGVLEKLVTEMEQQFHSPEAKRILYTLYDIGVTACCHIGDSRGAEKYFEKCTHYASLVSLDDYLGTRNKLVVFFCDYFDFERAEELSDENIMYQELLTDLKKELKLSGMSDTGFETMGKVHSQRGQVYAFMRDSRAEEEFRLALTHFVIDSANYKITQSYLLHYYLDTANKEAYLTEAERYFDGKKKLTDQLKYLIDEGSKNDPLINFKYALYIYVRALYLFRLSELTDKVWSELQKVEIKFGKKIYKKEWKLIGHPTEIIFKYMRLIALSRNEEELEEKYAQRMSTCLIYHGVTEDVIRMFGEVEVMDMKGDIAHRDELSLELCEKLTDDYSVFANLVISEDGKARFKWLEDKITFMYR